jgi:hypothetical protein
MGLMTINTVVSLSATLGEIPVADHSAMGTMLIVTKLRAMTLRTKLHDLRVREFRPICQSQGSIPIRGIVT